MRKQLITILLIIVFCLSGTGCSRDKKVNHENDAVFVESEFAPLKKVIVSESEFTDSMLPINQSYIPVEEMVNPDIRDGYIYFHVNENTMRKMAAEREELVSILEKYGVEVYRPRKLSEEEKALATSADGPTNGKGLSNFFVRDPFIVVGDHVIEANFRKEYRRFEAQTARDIYLKKCHYVGVPESDIDEEEAGPYLEGGDVLVYHKKVFVGNSGYGSNTAGIDWLRDYLAPYGYEVIEVKLQGNILHLDCALSLVKEGLMIVCEESFSDGIPEPFKNWDKITVSEEYAEHLAVNGMAINPEVYITDIAFKNTIGKQLEERGITVEYLDFSGTRSFAGSIHCSTSPVLRYDE